MERTPAPRLTLRCLTPRSARARALMLGARAFTAPTLRRPAARGWALVVLTAGGLALTCPAGVASAQPTEEAPPPTAAQRAEAGEHFDRGIQFFNEERYDAALAELARAYELAPAHQVLYNLARVHAALGNAVDAARAYERYLTEAGDAIQGRRRREAERALEEQRSRIGRLMIRVDVDGAILAIDGLDVATSPLSIPIELSAGSHTLEVRAAGRETARRAIAIAGQTEQRVEISLREDVAPRGTLRVTASLPEVAIAIDGEAVGVTPLSATLPLSAGSHVLSASRPGYQGEERTIEIEGGAEVEVAFEMRRVPNPSPDEVGRLRLHLPDAPYLIRVDEEVMLGTDLELPVGAHIVTLEVTDRQPYEGVVRVAPGSGIVIIPPLSWTLAARRQRLADAEQQRSLGLGLAVAGAVVAVGGLAVVIWNEAEISSTDSRLLQVIDGLDQCAMMGFDRECDELRAEGLALASEQDAQNIVRGLSIAATAVGAALGTLGLALHFNAPGEDDVDSAARATLRLGPAGVRLDGVF